MLGLNLHDVVRGVIPILHPDETCLLVQSMGNETVRGVVSSIYAEPMRIKAQIQSLSNDDLMALNDVSRTKIQRKAWLYSETELGQIPQGIVRTMERGGDILFRPDDQSWWLIAGMIEDFSQSGWVSVRLVLQETVPDTVIELVSLFEDGYWYRPENEGEDDE